MSRQCEICGTTENPGLKLVRDHNHATGYIRGLLCSPCNSRLGHYETGVLFYKYRASYSHWLELHKKKIEEYLIKPPTSILYTKSVRDDITGFSVGQMKEQARSNKSVYKEAAIKRLT